MYGLEVGMQGSPNVLIWLVETFDGSHAAELISGQIVKWEWWMVKKNKHKLASLPFPHSSIGLVGQCCSFCPRLKG